MPDGASRRRKGVSENRLRNKETAVGGSPEKDAPSSLRSHKPQSHEGHGAVPRPPTQRDSWLGANTIQGARVHSNGLLRATLWLFGREPPRNRRGAESHNARRARPEGPPTRRSRRPSILVLPSSPDATRGPCGTSRSRIQSHGCAATFPPRSARSPSSAPRSTRSRRPS